MRRADSGNEFTVETISEKNLGEKRSRRVSDRIITAITERLIG
jgi:hypothetical protein